MMRYIYSLILVLACATSIFAQPEHSLLLNGGGAPPSTLQGSTSGGIYILPPGSGTLVTTGSISGIAWLLAGNSLTGALPAAPVEFMGSTNNADVIFKANSVEKLRLASGGGATISGGLTSSGATTLSALGLGVVHSSAAGLLSSSPVVLTSATEVSGILPIANGGTNNNAAPTAGSVIYGNGTAHAISAVGTTGQTLHSNGAGAPTWSLLNLGSAAEVTGLVTVGNGGTGLGALASGSLLYGSAGNPMNALAIGGNGTVLTSNGAAPGWNALTTNASLSGNGTTTSFAINLLNTNNWGVNQNFNAGVTHTGATSPLIVNGTAGTAGDLLTSNGAGNTPSWNTISALSLIKSCALPTVNRVAMFTALAPTTICDAPLSVSGSDVTALGNLTVTNNVTVNGLTANQPVKTNGAKQLVSAAINLAGGATEVTGTLPIANGGTNGTAAPTAGGSAYGTGTAYAFTAAGVAGQTLHSNGAGAPTWGTVNLASATEVTGVLPIANGGSNGTAAPTAGAVSYGTGTAYAFTAAGVAGQTLHSNGAGTPTWSQIVDADVSPAAGIQYSKLSGTPTSLPPSGAAGGDLTGTYPNPVIAANAVTSAKIADGTIVNADISAAAAIAYSKLNLTGSVQGSDIAAGTFTTTNAHHAIGNNDNTARELRLLEPSGSGVNYTAFKAQAQAANVTYTLPNADGASGQVLKTDGAGGLSWQNDNSGGTSFSLSSSAANYNVTNTDQFVQITVTTGNKTVTLPAANTFAAGQSVIIKNLDPTASGNSITIATTGGEFIDDAAPGSFFANPIFSYQAVHLYSDGASGWYSW